MTGKPKSKIPKEAYYLLPFFGLWTCVNIYLGLNQRYGGAFGPQKTKFLIDESGKQQKPRWGVERSCFEIPRDRSTTRSHGI